MTKYLLIAFLSSFLILASHAQKAGFIIKGKVVDSISGADLEDASIIIKNITSGETDKKTVASKRGEFSFSLPAGSYKIAITHIGYEQFDTTFEVLAANVTLPVYFLHLLTGNLKTVTVETKKPFITLTAGKITLHVAESAVAAGNTAWDVLQIAPGVIASNDGSLSLNGKGVAVYMDGRPSYLSGEQLKNLLSAMQATAIDKIELISNPSARYDATGQAIINIKTKKNNKKGLNGVYTSGIGASRFVKYNTGIDLNYFKNKVNSFGSYDFSHNGNYYNPLNQRTSFTGGHLFHIIESENEIRKRNNQNYKAGFDFSPGKNTTMGMLFKAFSNHRSREVSGLTVLSMQKDIADSSIHAVTTGNAVFTSSALNFYFKKSVDSSKKELVINADYYRYSQQWQDDFVIDFKDHDGGIYKPGEARRDNSPTILDIYAATADYTRQFKKVKLETGIKTSFIKTDNNVRWENNFVSGWVNDALRTNYFIYQENIQAVYAGITTAFKKWELETMLRAEQTHTTGHSVTLNNKFSRQYLNLFPSLSVLKKLNKKNELTFSYRKSISRPYYSYTNPFLIYQGQYSYFQGNPDMKPSYSHSLEVIHSYNSLLFTTLSYTYVRDFTGVFYKQNDTTKTIIRYYDNYKSAQSWSLNIAFSKYLKPWWLTSTYATLAYETAAYGQVVAGRSTWQPYIGTYNNFTLKKAAMKIEVSGSYLPAYSDGFYKYKPYGGLNLGIQKDILKRKGSLKLSIRDIFKTYAFSYTALYSNVDIYTKAASDSRSIQLNFTYRFGKQFASKNKNRKSAIESETNRIN